MKANELMIDDWVQIVSDAPTMANEYHRIDWIRTGEVGLDNRKIVTYPYIQPIPLTPEILEKNGFEVQLTRDGGILYNSEIFKVIVSKPTEGCWRIYSNHFGFDTKQLFVHELQHALRLCGIEKEISL